MTIANLITFDEAARLFGANQPKIYANEAAFDADIKRFCKEIGVLTFHTYSSRKSEPGFPDRVILLDGWLYVLELKIPPNKATPEQRDWLRAFATLPNCTVRLVTPGDWPALARDIKDRAEAGR